MPPVYATTESVLVMGIAEGTGQGGRYWARVEVRGTAFESTWPLCILYTQDAVTHLLACLVPVCG